MIRTTEEAKRAAAMREIMRQMRSEGVCTQKEFAKKCGIPEATLSALLSGERPGTEERWRTIAEKAGWQYDALLDLGERIIKGEKEQPRLYIVTQQNNMGVVTGVSNGPGTPNEEFLKDLQERILEKLKGRGLEDRIALWDKIRKVLDEF